MTFASFTKFVATSAAISAIAFAIAAPLPSVFAQLQAGNAGAVIQPASEWVTGDSMTRKNFYVQVKPGEAITRSITVSNLGNEETRVLLNPEDRIKDVEQFTFTDSEELKEVGSWIAIASNDFKIGSQKSVTTNFTITVPAGTPAGEYAGVIAMEETAVNQEEQKGSGFKLRSRVGTRVYITVPSGELKHGIAFDTFEFVTPGSKSYDSFVKGYYRQDPTKVYMNWVYKNSGNVFTKMKGSLIISGPNGEVKTEFDRDLNTFDKTIDLFGLPTEAKWVPGNYKAVFEFENSPVSFLNREANLANVSPTQKYETSFTMTQEMIDKIKVDFEKLKNQRPTPNPAPVTPDDKKTSIEEYKEEPAKKENNTALYIAGGIGAVVVLALIGVILFLVLKMKKNKDEEDTKSSKKTSKKDSSLDKKVDDVTIDSKTNLGKSKK